MNQALTDLGDHIAAAQAQDVLATRQQHGELTVEVRAAALPRLLAFLRDDPTCRFAVLLDIAGADYPDRAERFEVVYHLLSVSQNQRLRVKLRTDGDTPVPTATGVYSSAGWYEREAWDLYGILFSGHPDLRRLLTDYGFDGHPMRKDFPLTGHVEVRYDEREKRVVYDPVLLQQEYRGFDFLSPWEGMTRGLPGDEKAAAGGPEEDAG